MLKSPPREKQSVSWLFVVIWSLIIFVTIPLARSLQEFAYQRWGRELFTYLVIAAITIAFLALAVYLRRHWTASLGNHVWLLGVAAIFLGYTIKLGKRSPEEAIHFVQYGVLGILVYRALTHRLRDPTVYFAAAIICGIVGIIDEIIQWLIPNRYWDLRDIWMNFSAAALVQVSIAKGLNPPIISGLPGRANLQFLFRIASLAVLLFGACLMNTPSRIAWYAEKVQWLAFLKENESMMIEYGYLYDDPATGVFRSRLSPEQLKESDQKRGKEAAAILDQYRGWPRYLEFLKTYTPGRDPFLHEARVHLRCRDHWFRKSAEHASDSEVYAECLTIAFRENQIMEKYFPNTLRHSSYSWSADKSALAKGHHLKYQKYVSTVSSELITRLSERHLVAFFVSLILGLALLQLHLGRKK